DRKELRQCGERRGSADRFQEGAARRILGKYRPHHRGCDDTFVTLHFAVSRRNRLAAQRPLRILMLGGGVMLSAGAAGSRELAGGIEGIIEGGHTAPLCRTGSRRTPCSAATWIIQSPRGRLLR